MYKDVEAKLKFYKEQIIQDMVNKGIFPDTTTIDNKLKEIDTSISIFKNDITIKKGSNFNTDDIRNKALYIFNDIKILYEILLDNSYKELLKLENYASSKMTELKNKTKNSLDKASIESNISSLGKTLLHLSSPFEFKKDNSSTYIDLGNHSLTVGSSISGLVYGTNVDNKNIKFILSNENNKIYMTPYNINQDLILIPGEIQSNKYSSTIIPLEYENSYMVLEKEDKDISNKIYKCFIGKGKAVVRNSFTKTDPMVYELSGFMPISLSSESAGGYIVEFYTVDATSVNFTFNKRPIAANFPLNSNTVSGLDRIHHFVIEVDNEIAFTCETDNGSIYACVEDGIINNNTVIIRNKNKITDISIEEYDTNKSEEYNISLLIEDDNNDTDVDTIIIKEILKVGEGHDFI